MNEHEECEDVKTDNDESGGQEDGWESKVTLPPGPLQSLLFESEWKLKRLHKDIHTHAL